MRRRGKWIESVPTQFGRRLPNRPGLDLTEICWIGKICVPGKTRETMLILNRPSINNLIIAGVCGLYAILHVFDVFHVRKEPLTPWYAWYNLVFIIANIIVFVSTIGSYLKKKIAGRLLQLGILLLILHLIFSLITFIIRAFQNQSFSVFIGLIIYFIFSHFPSFYSPFLLHLTRGLEEDKKEIKWQFKN